jgi:hypothetical protein
MSHGELLHGCASKIDPTPETDSVTASTIIALSASAKDCLHEALRQATAMGAYAVQPGHVLLGCLKAGREPIDHYVEVSTTNK